MQDSEVKLRDAAGSSPYYAKFYEWRQRLHVRRLDYLEVHAVVGGTARQVTIHLPTGDRSTHRLHPGQMFLFRPSDDQLVDVTEGALATVAVAFPLADWRAFVGFAGLDARWSESIPPPMGRFDPDDEEMRRTFQLVLERYESGPVRLDLVHFWGSVIPRILPPDRSATTTLPAPEWFVRSLEAMREEENLRAGLGRFLQLAHVSRQHLSESTRRYLGKTPTEAIQSIRLAHAATLLGTTRATVAEIALRCGCATAAYFSTCFRAAYFVSPREFRKRAADLELRSIGAGSPAPIGRVSPRAEARSAGSRPSPAEE